MAGVLGGDAFDFRGGDGEGDDSGARGCGDVFHRLTFHSTDPRRCV